jgi:hypothetical protein
MRGEILGSDEEEGFGELQLPKWVKLVNKFLRQNKAINKKRNEVDKNEEGRPR